ncbi:MAG: FG-GAP-like repeat-containing protein, partial [Acidobacteriota bacterium]
MKKILLLLAWTLVASSPLRAQCASAQFSLAPATDGGLPTNQSVAVGDSPNEVAVGFFDADPFPDFATAESIGQTVSVRLGDGDGTFTAAPTISFSGNTPRSIVAGDFDGEGGDDLVLVTLEGRVFFVAGRGDGTF